jgi:hypothetical protein
VDDVVLRELQHKDLVFMSSTRKCFAYTQFLIAMAVVFQRDAGVAPREDEADPARRTQQFKYHLVIFIISAVITDRRSGHADGLRRTDDRLYYSASSSLSRRSKDFGAPRTTSAKDRVDSIDFEYAEPLSVDELLLAGESTMTTSLVLSNLRWRAS